MRPVLPILLLAAALTGCSSQYVVRASSGGQLAVPAASGGSIASGPTGLYVSIGIGTAAAEVLAWMTGVAIYAAMLADERGAAGHAGGPVLAPWSAPMREDRIVVEADCTRALPEGITGNLRCK
jgi:hypothetical protein